MEAVKRERFPDALRVLILQALESMAHIRDVTWEFKLETTRTGEEVEVLVIDGMEFDGDGPEKVTITHWKSGKALVDGWSAGYSAGYADAQREDEDGD